jgi:hypothetical protein
MSLLIGIRGAGFVVVLTDGMSVRMKDGQPVPVKLDQRKIFPIHDLPCALVHHGLNEVGGVGIEQLMTNQTFIKMQARSWSKGLNVALARTITHLDAPVSQTMKSLAKPFTFGLWFAGLWPCTRLPELTELVWHEPTPKRVRTIIKPHESLVIGGSGMRFIRDYLSAPADKDIDVSKIGSSPAEYSMELIKRLYEVAIRRQRAEGKPPIFGGQRQMAVITRDGVDYGPLP